MSRIWIFNHDAMTPYQGTLTRHYAFSKYLLEKGHDVTIFASSVVHNTDINMIKDDRLFLEQVIDGRRFVFVKTSPYQSNGFSRVRNMLDYYFNLRKTVRQYAPPDIIYGSSPQILSIYAGVREARRLCVPCVSEVRDLWPESIVEYNGVSRMNPLIQALYRLEKYVYRKSDAIIFTMEGMYDYIREKGWTAEVDEKKCHYINNGVDIEEFNQEISKYPFDDPDLTDESVFRVIYCGSIRRANNIDLLVDCAAELNARPGTNHILFLIYGDGPDRQLLEQRCKSLGLNNIRFKGFVEKKHIAYILSRSHLNILNYRASTTQRYGNSSNKLFEYLAAGHPVLSNIDEGKYPIISKYGCGEILSERSSKAYADAVERFAHMEADEYRSYCDNALKTAQLFDIRRMAQHLEEVLTESIHLKKARTNK